MAAFEGSMKSQLQGVSQQIARERLDGQVTAQDNMLSDAVTGLRRRPGAQWVATFAQSAGAGRLLGWNTDVGGIKAQFVLNTNTGVVSIYSEAWALLQTLPAQSYLINADRRVFHATVVGTDFFILNTAIKPYVSGSQGGQDPQHTGFFYLKTGAFEKAYTVTLTDSNRSETFTYTTPAASVTGAAAQSTPEYINGQLEAQIGARNYWGVAGLSGPGAYTYVTSPGTGFNVSTPLPSSYIGVSNQSYVPTEGDLPAVLSSAAGGMIIAVGSLRTPTYFQYVVASSAWLEVGSYNSPSTLANMPMRIIYTGGAWQYSAPYEGRLSGDDTSNPAPAFITRGITGMGSFQNRLVLLAGNMVDMSASNKPGRFFRSSVADVVASDPIEVGAAANSSAAYQYCVPFQRDLLLFSEKYQALVPGGNVAITPSNATVIITSTYEADMASSPITTGRTMMYPAPRSADFFGILEMVPSQYTDSQYLSQDVTAHLPKYLAGRCRFSVSSSVANLVLFATDRDMRTLIVHEYQWNGSDKVQQSWHRWTFPYDIADAFFTGSEINLLFYENGQMLVAAVDPKIGTLTAQIERRPFLDLYRPGTVAGNVLTIPTDYLAFDPAIASKLMLADTDANLAGEEVGVDSYTSSALTTVSSFPAGPVNLGVSYRSTISPTTPVIKDANGVVISSNKLTILRYMVGTSQSSEYNALVSDSSTSDDDSGSLLMPVLYWDSAELALGSARINNESTAILPCRTNADTTTLALYTEGLGEMNLISLEYVCRYNQKLRRR